MRHKLLPHRPFADRRHARRHRRGKHERKHAPAGHVTTQVSMHDPAAQRVRNAGGPLDEASYTCSCGYVFAAAVSTTVECPHCGAGQAW